MTCRDCKHFYVRNHKAYCDKRGDYLIPDGYSCPNFESTYQITTTRNPYLNQGSMLDVSFNVRKEYNKMFKMDKVKKVIFNPPATIVYWFDGTKTIVKVQDGEVFDKEKGFAMACAKKFFGNKGNYYDEFRKHGADKDGYSISVDTALIGKVVRSGIEDGVFSCTCELDPSIVDQLCELGNVTDHTAGLKTELTCDGPITEQYIEASVLDEKPVGGVSDFDLDKKSTILCDELKKFADCRGLEVRMHMDSKTLDYYIIEFEYKLFNDSYTFPYIISREDMKNKNVFTIKDNVTIAAREWFNQLTIANPKECE